MIKNENYLLPYRYAEPLLGSARNMQVVRGLMNNDFTSCHTRGRPLGLMQSALAFTDAWRQ